MGTNITIVKAGEATAMEVTLKSFKERTIDDDRIGHGREVEAREVCTSLNGITSPTESEWFFKDLGGEGGAIAEDLLGK